MDNLTSRQKTILRMIVKDFISSALPVGSKHLWDKQQLGISPATIRSTMAYLEELGYVYQPHTSAGRIPTDRGYRFYVDLLMPEGSLTPEELSTVVDTLHPHVGEIEDLISTASKLLGRLSTQLGIVVPPRILEGKLVRMELISLASQAVLVVLQLETGFARTIVLEIESDIPSDALEMLSARLNERLAGLSLLEIRKTLPERISGFSNEKSGIVRLLIDSADRVFDFTNREIIRYGGSENLMKKPEFQDPGKLGMFMKLLEEEKPLIELVISASDDEKVNVLIGRELSKPELADFSIVSAKYHIGEFEGVLAVVGPKRMEYDKAVAVVFHTADVITDALSN